jgi:hypothetical protein
MALITLAALAFAWGIWMVSTPDYQGGRHFAGGLILAAGVIVGIVGVIAAISARRVDS